MQFVYDTGPKAPVNKGEFEKFIIDKFVKQSEYPIAKCTVKWENSPLFSISFVGKLGLSVTMEVRTSFPVLNVYGSEFQMSIVKKIESGIKKAIEITESINRINSESGSFYIQQARKNFPNTEVFRSSWGYITIGDSFQNFINFSKLKVKSHGDKDGKEDLHGMRQGVLP